jgi:hypothetical protein
MDDMKPYSTKMVFMQSFMANINKADERLRTKGKSLVGGAPRPFFTYKWGAMHPLRVF